MIVKIEKLDDFGRGITFINNKICFVENALIDEVVVIEIIKENKKYSNARVVNYINKNNSIRSFDEIIESFGSCNISHMSYMEENKFKKNRVINNLNKFKINYNKVIDIVFKDEYFYRNKITLYCDGKNLGFYKRGTNDIIDLDFSYLVNEKINYLISEIRKRNFTKIKEIMIRSSNDLEQSIIKIVGDVKIKEFLNLSDVLIVNDKVISNNKNIITSIGNVKYYLSSDSFFQVNRFISIELFNYIKDNVNGCFNVLDLFCGTGSIGIYVGKYNNIFLTGIDNNKSNILDALNNAKLNNVKANFICDNVENSEIDFSNIDLVIIDPPRKGINRKTVDLLNKEKVKKIIYISCDAYTFSRDLKLLSESYIIEKIKLFNMFPRTHHVESVAILTKKL